MTMKTLKAVPTATTIDFGDDRRRLLERFEPRRREQSAENGVRQLLDELIESPIDGYTVKRLPSDVYEVLRPGETSHAPVYGNKEVASAGQSVSGQNGHKT